MLETGQLVLAISRRSHRLLYQTSDEAIFVKVHSPVTAVDRPHLSFSYTWGGGGPTRLSSFLRRAQRDLTELN